MDIRQLRYFATIAQLGSFSRAATVLRVSQPSLSKQVSLLEDELGRRLLVRNGRGVTPTEAGQRLQRHAQRILDLFAEAEADVRSTGAGRFAIGLPFTLAATIATELLSRLRKQEPSANLAVIQGRSAFLVDSLCTGTIDVAITYTPASTPLVETTPLISEPLYLMASQKNARLLAKKGPIALEDLCEFPLIAPTRPNAIRTTLEDALRRAKRTARFAMEVDNIETIVELVAKGEGYAVLSKLSRSLSPHKQDVVPVPIAPPGLRSEICMAVSTRGSLSQANGRLIKLTGDIARELLQDAAERRIQGND
jgi:LysR family transcriptional regulator, nitrogen assimilation regulatory protein